MTAGIEIVNGRASTVFLGNPGWTGLGQKIDGKTFWEAFQMANMDWDVLTRPLFNEIGGEVPAQEVYRGDTGAHLGVVGPRWTPLQNRHAFEVFEPLVDSGDLVLNTAGVLFGGKRIWVLCELNLDNAEIVPGDEVAKFALLSNGHDGKLAVHFGFTPIRVVCANTEAMARSCEASKLIRVRHHRFVKQNVEKLRDIMNLANQEFEATAEQYRFLASRQINEADLHKYVKVVMGAGDKDDEDISTRMSNIISDVENLFANGQGNNLPHVAGTWWAAYNGVTEYLSYIKGRTDETRYDSLWFGQNKLMNENALATALELAS